MSRNNSHIAMHGGSRWWPLSYAILSIRTNTVRNMGIVLVLAIGISLPSMVFVWASSGTVITIEDYFSRNLYQMSIEPDNGQTFASSDMADAISLANRSGLVETTDVVLSTVGILQGDSIPTWSYYSMYATNYLYKIKDMRVIFVTNGLLARWSDEFSWRGNFSLSLHQVLVSEQFVRYVHDVHNISVNVGSIVDVDILCQRPYSSEPQPPEKLGRLSVKDLYVAGVYDHTDGLTLISSSMPSISRKNWDALGPASPVLGLDDSIMLLEEELDSLTVQGLYNDGFFTPIALLRASQSALLAAGANKIRYNLESLFTLVQGSYPDVTIRGLTNIWQLDEHIQTYLQSQLLSVIAFPVFLMSLMLTSFISDIVISRRRGEINSLRAKGASFSQVFSSFIWEALILSLIALFLGVGMSIIAAAAMGATTGLFVFDPSRYNLFLTHIQVPVLSLVLAAAISMCLPITYMLQIARRIDVGEVGLPHREQPEDFAEEESVLKNSIGLTLILVSLLVLPTITSPTGVLAVGEILIVTLMLFIASYLGSKVLRHVTARITLGSNFLFGEKSLYFSRSLQRRKGRLIPLLVILTLTLTTTSMMLVQESTLEFTTMTELQYAIGADMRIECDSYSLYYNESLLHFPGVLAVTPVIETKAKVGDNLFFLEGVDPIAYSSIGLFSDSSFTSGTPSAVLNALAEDSMGIVISSHYSNIWNKSVGDNVSVSIDTKNSTMTLSFHVVGLMYSAPGFGLASTDTVSGPTFASQFGFQVGLGGFALVNVDLLYEIGGYNTTNLFLLDIVPGADVSQLIDTVDSLITAEVYTAESFDIAEMSYSIHLFLSGLQGLIIVSFVLCLLMGLSAIILFLGSAVIERTSEYALFRALGIRRRQVVSLVLGEFAGSILAAICISIVLGAIFGYSLSVLTFGISPFIPILGRAFVYPVHMMTVVLALECAAMLVSSYLPARRASAIEPAKVLRNL